MKQLKDQWKQHHSTRRLSLPRLRCLESSPIFRQAFLTTMNTRLASWPQTWAIPRHWKLIRLWVSRQKFRADAKYPSIVISLRSTRLSRIPETRRSYHLFVHLRGSWNWAVPRNQFDQAFTNSSKKMGGLSTSIKREVRLATCIHLFHRHMNLTKSSLRIHLAKRYSEWMQAYTTQSVLMATSRKNKTDWVCALIDTSRITETEQSRSSTSNVPRASWRQIALSSYWKSPKRSRRWYWNWDLGRWVW